MISKRAVAVGICLSVIVGLVVMPAFADRYRATPEAEAVETPAAEENLIGSAYNRVAGTVYIAGKTITGTAKAAGGKVLDTADAGGKAVVRTHKAGRKTLRCAADASGRALGGAADAVTGTAGAAYRKVVGGEEPAEEVQIEEIAIEQPKEKGLFQATWDAIAGTAGAIGRTFGAVYASVFPVK